MDEDYIPDTPMLGALLVSEGLVAPEQLAACLLLQQHDYPHLRLGEILLRCGYISHESLDRAIRLQRNMQDSLTAAFDAQMPAAGDLAVLVIARRPSDVLSTLLGRMGVSLRYSSGIPADLDSRRPDLVLVEASRLHACDSLPDWCLVELLPEINRYLFLDMVPAGMVRLLERYVRKAREQRASHQEAIERRQLDGELDALAGVTHCIAEAATAHDLLTRLIGLARQLLRVEAATLFRVDSRNGRLVFEVVLGPNQGALAGRTLPIGHGIAGWVAHHGEPLIIPDVHHDRRFAGNTDHNTGFQTRSMLCVPMSAFGKLYGVLQLINKEEDEFNERDLQLLRTIASYGALAMACKSPLAFRSAVMRERALGISA